ncbi:MAG: segregation and condensation protein A [Gammaproteobacteria bacterium]|nr:segregation and condensation protein A [Gammaproteobacteria bacterium]
MSTEETTELTAEQRILKMMKRVLTDVARDTGVRPGRAPVLSEHTVLGIRDCLGVISAREAEIAEEMGTESNMRPRYVDEPKTVHTISIDSIRKKKDLN